MSFNKSLLETLRARGWRVTAARRAVVEALARAGCAADVQTVYRIAKRAYPKLGLVTVYRTLDLLAREGWVQRWEEGGAARYELDQPHHHHLVCLACGSVQRWDRCPVRVREGATLGGFVVTGHRLDLVGYCRSCREVTR
jgi:Fe2+ or Zn2+ uptake regulation protein